MLTAHALSPETWHAYAALIERNKGVWGGCWCMGFHSECIGKHKTAAQNKAEKQARVWAGTALAVLMFEGVICLGWAQFGQVDEVPRIKNRKAYEAGLALRRLADHLFLRRARARGRGVADAALAGALKLIAGAGGGIAEGYPNVVERKMSSSFLFHETTSSFDRLGFVRDRAIGKTRWVMRYEVERRPRDVRLDLDRTLEPVA